MMTEDNKMYVLKLKYTVIDVTKKKSKRKITRKKEKLYLVKDPDQVEDKLKELEDNLLEEQQVEKNTILNQCQEFLKSFGSRCNKTYYSILRS